MGHPKVIAAGLACLFMSGCASVHGLRWEVQKSLRSPGEEMKAFPDAVWLEYDCESQKRPFFVIEENELIPPRVKAGGDFNHRSSTPCARPSPPPWSPGVSTR